MGRPLFENADFIAAARAIADERGPAGVTIDSVTRRLKAPKGSFYYRFNSRDALLGELWLSTVLDYQPGFIAALEADNGLAAALHTPVWARSHMEEARLLLLYSRHDFVQGDWPAKLKRGVRDQAQRLESCVEEFTRRALGRLDAKQLRRARFVLLEVPIAAVKMHLERRELPPPLVDELIAKTYARSLTTQGTGAVFVKSRDTARAAQGGHRHAI
jgi:AcrR family transcriptional regulator